jgi:hypothetical protein
MPTPSSNRVILSRPPCPRCGGHAVTYGVRAEPGRVLLLKLCSGCSHRWELERPEASRSSVGILPRRVLR